MHITGFEDAANLHSWKSPSVMIPLLLSVPLWLSFVVSQYYITISQKSQEHVFPWRCFTNRVTMGLILNAFLSGAISITCMIQIPTRLQTAIVISAMKAGIYLIPFTLAMLVAIVIKKRRLSPVYLALMTAAMQLVGVVLLSLGPIDNPGYKAMYGIEFVVGLGVGADIAVTTLMMPHAIEKRELSVGAALIISFQFRFLGAAAALAIVAAVGNAWLRDSLSVVLNSEETTSIFRRPDVIKALPDLSREMVQWMFVKSFNLQMRILIGFTAAHVPVTFLTWKGDVK
ncbi:hypothetical protein P280DRAFT_422076 [Massarina eburnea CBS 473.64]|uniref:MFS general substrate transporter n=1 Tax=Massarina eburnea CBS 473.64 TaxID=1395130 RepID=A0A6A6S7Y0_9PLEO|nr:hypothetical protein P280DRAFT_422076 [Massarina eburnea CBS 473.64]